ncbi:hypothetical protein [Lysinibacillus fusiformis]|uniref:hypothetical protein n=1 Tax=Lysinibacillus fusiformis TaxID=28031 RepID=UPI003D00AAAA
MTTPDLNRLYAAAVELPTTCRYHGSDFGFLGWEQPGGPPRCDSCKAPWRKAKAMEAYDRLVERDAAQAATVADLTQQLDQAQRAQRLAESQTRIAGKHATTKDAEIAEAEERLLRARADGEARDARWARHIAECEYQVELDEARAALAAAEGARNEAQAALTGGSWEWALAYPFGPAKGEIFLNGSEGRLREYPKKPIAYDLVRRYVGPWEPAPVPASLTPAADLDAPLGYTPTPVVAVTAADGGEEPDHTITCRTCGPVPYEQIHLLTWDSPHGDERCTRCGGGDLDIPNPDDAVVARVTSQGHRIAADLAGRADDGEGHSPTAHGHRCCGRCPEILVPLTAANCGGPRNCEQCADDRDETRAGRAGDGDGGKDQPAP